MIFLNMFKIQNTIPNILTSSIPFTNTILQIKKMSEANKKMKYNFSIFLFFVGIFILYFKYTNNRYKINLPQIYKKICGKLIYFNNLII